MAKWCSLIEVAGVSFTGCRGQIMDAANFMSPFRGSVEWTNDGGVNAQQVNTNYKGVQFGLAMSSVEITKMNLLKAAALAAQMARTTFEVWLVDELHNIRCNAILDSSQARPISHGDPLGGYVEEVVIRFICKQKL